MSELQRGTAVIPTIDADGKLVSVEMAEQISELLREIKHLPLRAEMHDAQAAVWESLGLPRTPGTFAGFNVSLSLGRPTNQIRILYDSHGIKADGTRMDPITVAQIVNLGLPCQAACAT